MKILKTISEKVKKITPKKLIRKTFQENITEILLLSISSSGVLSLLGLSLACFFNKINYFVMSPSETPDLANPLILIPTLFTLIAPIWFKFFYEITKIDEQKEMYILSEDEMFSFIKEYDQQKWQEEIINKFQEKIKEKGSVNYYDLLIIHRNIEEKINKTSEDKIKEKKEKASICFGEKMREEFKLAERIKDCV